MANFLLTKNNNYPAGVNPVPGTDTITAGGDSGNIVCVGPPGVAAVKLTDMTQQQATTAKSDSTVAGGGGSYLTPAQVATFGPDGPSLGYSILGE